MNPLFSNLKKNQVDNYILPFLWMKGEEEAVIREEIEKIDECGIKAFCLESRPHPDFMGDKWWSDLTLIIHEAKKRDMKVWILDDAHFPTGYANGLIKTKYPDRKKKYLNYNVVNVWGPKGEITIPVSRMIKPMVSFLELDKPRDIEEQQRNKVVAVIAYPLREDNKLDEAGAIDLTSEIKGNIIKYAFPKDNYRIFVIYETRTDGGNSDYINMMDQESVSTLLEAVYEPHYEHFKEEFGKVIAGFFSDEPEIGNIGSYKSDVQIGNSKMALPWSEQLHKKMTDLYGGAWKLKLPFLWTESVQMKECPQARYQFMEAFSSLYSENFSKQLGDWCAAHKVEYIGHVVEDDNLHGRLGNGAAHYFRAMQGQHMAGIDVIGDQIAFGGAGYLRMGLFERDGEFLHYALGKLGASCGHLDPKKNGRTMCELFGASGWKLGVRDMKWILDHLLVRGVNTLVPHAFSMGDYPDQDCPPHFYARGNNPQFRQFGNLMRYANRMCEIFNNGSHIASSAILYHAEAEWGGNCMLMQKPAKELVLNQIEFDFVSVDMIENLKDYHGRVQGSSFFINHQEFHHLVIPYVQRLPYGIYDFIVKNPGISVVFVNDLPEAVLGKEVSENELQIGLKACKVVALKELGLYLKQEKNSDIQLDQVFPELAYYHYHKEIDYYMLNNESAFDTFQGEITIPLKNGAVYYDGMKNEFYQMNVIEKDGKKSVFVELAPYGSCVICDTIEDNLPIYETLSQKLGRCNHKQELSNGWCYATASEKEYPNFGAGQELDELIPISDVLPEFSGHICYEKQLEVKEVSDTMYLEFGHVFEVIALWINDRYVGSIQNPPYVFDVSGFMNQGRNSIKTVVTTTLDRDQLRYPEPFIILNHDISENTGMYGRIMLYYA